jgi:hypothetical protein
VESPLSFANTESFRNSLIKFNLEPYSKPSGNYTSEPNYEYIQSNYSVVDSPDQLIDEPIFANTLYPLNQYGTEGGYEQVLDPTTLKNTKSNEGEYGPGQQDAKIFEQGIRESKTWKKINVYSDGTDTVVDSAEFFDSLDIPQNILLLANNQPYYQFIFSNYSPLSLLLSNDPQGSNGLLSQDSYLAQLGATSLRKDFEARIALQIEKRTRGRANILNIDSATDILNLASGRVPLIEPDWTITVPRNPIIETADLTLRLAGGYIPLSPIPGSYWNRDVQNRNPSLIQQLRNTISQTGIGNFFNRLVGADRTGSQIFFDNTGRGQKLLLFRNIDHNKFKPFYDRDLVNSITTTFISTLTGSGDFYIGSTTTNPSNIFSPPGEIPVNEFGIQQQTPVYGPSELAKIYEDPQTIIKLGSNGPIYSDGGGVEGGLTWVSPKYKNNAGKKVGVGGSVVGQDEDFNSSSFGSTESTNYSFKRGSILDKTQRIINSQPNGAKRLQHVGNAIDQVSKVFNDGYKEITKGSKVLTYIGEAGQEVGTEYCRIFTKDTPYLQYNDLQKTDGMTTEGRKFSYSVLDKTYNLNIVPNKQEGGQNSTNLIGGNENGHAKKYMFSLENLAWRTSNRSGLSVADLPICERGPNNGRVMWFPPYNLTFSETVNAGWKSQDFLGRSEPVYTYTNTKRSGQISFDIVVDHPSVLNVIVNKILSKETNRTRINSILDSFFAGCRKYDLYDLAKKYNTINPNDLYELQKIINEKPSKEVVDSIIKETVTGVDSPNGNEQLITQDQTIDVGSELNYEFQNVGFYFDNAIPRTTDSVNFESQYNSYQVRVNDTYSTKDTADETKALFDNVVTKNFDKVKELAKKISDIFKDETTKGTITISVDSSCSAPASLGYNQQLSERRFNTFKNYFETNEFTKNLISNGKLIISKGNIAGEVAQVEKYDENGNKISGSQVNCSDTNPLTVNGDSVGSTEIFTINAMACRRAVISSITGTITQPITSEKPLTEVVQQQITEQTTINVPQTEQTEVITQGVLKNNITKKVLRSLLSECDYFEMIKEETPMVFDNLRDKLKYFQPAFHSITPEGLNSRLTFLQQCFRPGDTIPTVKDFNGTTSLQYDNAINTAFGAPPVLVLRIGDFYNTKIIPNNLTLTFEHLDINPEGIGVQPMIAKVSISFDFVGGSGLKEAISKLQNALSFNFYANTEMYDDRSDVTDTQIAGKDIKVFDEEFFNAIGGNLPPTVNQTQNLNGQTNLSPIGEVLEKITTDDNNEQGKISYSKFMDSLVNKTQNYFLTVINKNREVSLKYNNAIRQQWMLSRNYTRGKLTVDTVNDLILFGKPNNVEQRIDQIFNNYITDITNKNEDDLFVDSVINSNLQENVKTTILNNYNNFIRTKRNNFTNELYSVIQEVTREQQDFVNILGQVNVITYEAEATYGTDGYQTKKGNVITYLTTGTTEVNKSSTNSSDTFEELVNDVITIKDDIVLFNEAIEEEITFKKKRKNYLGYFIYPVDSNGQRSGDPTIDGVFEPFSSDEEFQINNTFRRQYMILSNDILDDNKYETFKQSIIGTLIQSNDVVKIFDDYWLKTARPKFKEENDLTIEFLDYVESNKLKDFTIYKPFNTKSRVFDFSTNYSSTNKSKQEELIKSLNLSTPITNNTSTWNDEKNSVYISKPKLN